MTIVFHLGRESSLNCASFDFGLWDAIRSQERWSPAPIHWRRFWTSFRSLNFPNGNGDSLIRIRQLQWKRRNARAISNAWANFRIAASSRVRKRSVAIYHLRLSRRRQIDTDWTVAP